MDFENLTDKVEIAVATFCSVAILMWPVATIHEIHMGYKVEQSRKAFERERVLLEKYPFNEYEFILLKDYQPVKKGE